jgi:microcystin degradation protein MlrC
MPFGDAVWVRAEPDLDLILHTKRSGTLRPEVITDFGIDLAAKRIVVAKMWRHGETGFAGVTSDFKILKTPGTQTLDYAAIPFRVFDRPYWPRVEDPFGADGA